MRLPPFLRRFLLGVAAVAVVGATALTAQPASAQVAPNIAIGPGGIGSSYATSVLFTYSAPSPYASVAYQIQPGTLLFYGETVSGPAGGLWVRVTFANGVAAGWLPVSGPSGTGPFVGTVVINDLQSPYAEAPEISYTFVLPYAVTPQVTPNDDAAYTGTLAAGTRVYISDSTTDGFGQTWYQLATTDGIARGWVKASALGYWMPGWQTAPLAPRAPYVGSTTINDLG